MLLSSDKLSKVKSDDYTGRFIDKDGNVAYDSPSDFLKHMFGTPKKRSRNLVIRTFEIG